ncbi:hypothetical protein GF312_09185 [Candidatus Poribacteria bacterium]|nr:hypothetical protein [Candidatus Poribacteria bacterium]
MFIWHILTAIIVGVLVTVIFAVIFHRKGPWQNVGIFFLIIFLGVWAASLWIVPVGPNIMGIYWVPVLLTGLILGLLMIAATPQTRVSEVQEEVIVKGQYEEEREYPVKEKKIDTLLWAFLGITSIALLIAIIVGYVVTG